MLNTCSTLPLDPKSSLRGALDSAYCTVGPLGQYKPPSFLLFSAAPQGPRPCQVPSVLHQLRQKRESRAGPRKPRMLDSCSNSFPPEKSRERAMRSQYVLVSPSHLSSEVPNLVPFPVRQDRNQSLEQPPERLNIRYMFQSSFSSPERCQELGASSQSHGAVPGGGALESQHHKFPSL